MKQLNITSSLLSGEFIIKTCQYNKYNENNE